jgi:hypothetical protein
VILAIAGLLPVLAGGSLVVRPRAAAGAPDAHAIAGQPPAETAAPPRPPKERMEVAVLLAWVWLSIAVLLWIVRLKVREADRVSRLGLGRPPGSGSEGPRE